LNVRGRVAAVLAAVGLAAASRAGAADPFTDCAAQFSARPTVYDSANCFFQVGQRTKRWDEAARRLDALRGSHPTNFWLTVARGNLEWTRDLGRAEELYRAAADGFARERQVEGEIFARYNLRTILFRKGQLEQAGHEVERVMRLAEASGQTLLQARAFALKATHLTDTGGDLEEAYGFLRRAEPAASAEAPYILRRSILFGLANVCFQRGRYDEALGYYRRVEDMAAKAGDMLNRTSAQYGVVNTLMRQMEELPRPGGREEVLALARAALVDSEEADNRETQVMLHRTLGELLGGLPGRKAEAERHYERCVTIARSIDQPRELAHCLWSLGHHLAEQGHPREARQRIEEALALARGTGHHWSLAHASRERMRVSWRTRPREEAIAECLSSLDAIETLRRLQDDKGAAEVFSAWARDYYWLAGRLLDRGAQEPGREDVARAFAVTERMRARVLLEVLSASDDGRGRAADHPLTAKRRDVLQRMAETHRELLDPGLGPDARRAALGRLESLELEEEEVRRGLRAAGGRAAASAEPRFARLEEVEASLDPEEALLSFTIGLWTELSGDFGGGAWLTVSTRRGTKAYRLPDRVHLQAVVPVFLGLFERRDGQEAGPAASLYKDLLADALADLPPGIERLVVIPDDALHRVPFAALRSAPAEEPLVARYQIALAPSATLWLRWKRASPPVAARPALVLADPILGDEARTPSVRGAAQERGGASVFGASLGALPHAREEGVSIVRRLGRRSELLLGRAASEQALKTTPLDQFGILHFAAHAVVDEERPERSAVFLAPGSASEDGLLQVREVVDLSMEGRVVVLSACRTARGSILRGEGVLGLGRAFFQAGSHAVVGSLWPLRDDDAALLFDVFYRRLDEGASLGAALRDAQRQAIRAGRPAAAWAGLVVMGNGGLRPVSADHGAGRWRLRWLLAGAIVLTLAFFSATLVRRLRRPR
jgi:CHAT domain-containing protein/tetratricopeptide (TPR) repeat protein